MQLMYELMDVESGNLVGYFESKAEALATVQDAFERFGQTGVFDLALSQKHPDGSATLVADGDDLLQLARQPQEVESARS